MLDEFGDVGARRQMIDDRIEDVARLRGRRGPLAHAFEEIEEWLHAARKDGFVERLLAIEMVVETRRRQPHLAGDVAHGRAREAPLGEETLGHVEDSLARGLRFRRGALPCGITDFDTRTQGISGLVQTRGDRGWSHGFKSATTMLRSSGDALPRGRLDGWRSSGRGLPHVTNRDPTRTVIDSHGPSGGRQAPHDERS